MRHSTMVHAQTRETGAIRHSSHRSKAELLFIMSLVFLIAAGISAMAYFVNPPPFYSPATPIIQAGSYQITSSNSSFTFPVNQGNVRYDAATNTIVISNFPGYTVIFVHASVSTVEHPETVVTMNPMIVTSSRPLTLAMIQNGLHLTWKINSLEVSNLNSAYVILSGIMTIIFFAAFVGTLFFGIEEKPEKRGRIQ